VLFDPWVRDPDPGFGIEKKSGFGSGMNIPEYFSEILELVFRVKKT
jgi:hypothetical protein